MNAIRLSHISLVLLTAVPASAQVKRPVPTITAQTVSAPVAAGSTVHVVLKVVLPEGLHVQSDKPRDPGLIPTALTIAAPPGVKVLRTTYPKAEDFKQAGGGPTLAVFSGTFLVDVQLSIAPSVRSGALEVPGELRYQSCTEQVCFPPSRAPVTWRLHVQQRSKEQRSKDQRITGSQDHRITGSQDHVERGQ